MKQYSKNNKIKHSALLGFMLLVLMQSTLLAGPTRILNIKPVIESKEKKAKLKDFVTNDHLLTDAEKEFEIIDVPSDRDKVISIIDFAYLLQQYEEMMDAKVSGPRKLRIKRNNNSQELLRSKAAITAEIKRIAPWSEWEVDILFGSNDDIVLNRIKEFNSVEVMPYNNRAMLGNIQFRTTFLDSEGRETGNALVNPVILKKVDVAVIDRSCKKGQILDRSDVKTIPIWVGSNKRDYITDLSECVGRETAKTLSAGDLIKASDLMNPICAKKGDIVWIESKKGALSVTLAVTALQTGRMGEVIRFRNKSSKKEFSAKLVGDKQAVHEMAP